MRLVTFRAPFRAAPLTRAALETASCVRVHELHERARATNPSAAGRGGKGRGRLATTDPHNAPLRETERPPQPRENPQAAGEEVMTTARGCGPKSHAARNRRRDVSWSSKFFFYVLPHKSLPTPPRCIRPGREWGLRTARPWPAGKGTYLLSFTGAAVFTVFTNASFWLGLNMDTGVSVLL